MTDIQSAIKGAKDSLPNITPTPPSLKAESAAYDLKARLEWGEPALTIIDVRDREVFNQGRITGAVPMPLEQLENLAQSALEPERDIYVYGESDEQVLQAVEILRGAGFVNVARVMGGLQAWREVGGPTEGIEEGTSLQASAFNVVSRLQAEQKLQKVGKTQQSKRT